MTREKKQLDVARNMVKMSAGRLVPDKHGWLRTNRQGRQQVLDEKTIKQHLKIVNQLLRRHIGQIGNIEQMRDVSSKDFYNKNVRNTEFSHISPETNEHLFLYLTRLVKYIHSLEKVQLNNAARILLQIKKKK